MSLSFICGEISQIFEQYELQNFGNLTTLKEKYLDVHTRKKLDEALENLMNALFVERKRRMVDKVIAMTTTEPSRTFTFSFGPMYIHTLLSFLIISFAIQVFYGR